MTMDRALTEPSALSPTEKPSPSHEPGKSMLVLALGNAQ